MLNKNDPLIGAVQEVMKRNQIEREATRLVNEAFGIEDRRALPHEYQAEWDAAYQQALAEAVDPSKYSEKQKRFAATAGNPRKIDSADLAHVRKHGGKHIEERKLNPYAVGMAAVKKSTGDEPPMEKKNIMKAHKIAKKIMKKSMDESAGAPGGMVDYMQKKAKREAAQKASQNKGSDPTNTPGGARAGYTAPRGADPTNTPSGQRAGAAPKPANLDAKAPGMGGPNYVPNKGIDKVAPKPKAKPVAAAPKVAAPKAKAPKAVAPQPKKKLTFFQKSELARSRKNDTMDQTRNLERRYGVRAPMKKAKKSVFEEQIQNAIAEAMSPSAGAQGGVNAASIQQQKAAVMQKRKDLGTSVMSGRVGDPGKQNFIQNARAQKEREKAAGGDGTKYLPVPPNVQQAIRNNQPQPGRPQTLSPGANPPVSKNMGGGGGDYRRAQSSPIKVSDTEVMNDPKFKKALSSVGGTQAAKKIQTGERVSGLGRMNKGDTIMSRVRTDIAARKNVGRES